MTAANLSLRFLLELVSVGSLAVAGYQLPTDGPLRWVVAAGLPLLLVVVWAVVVAPNAQNGLTQTERELIGTALLVIAAGALALAGQPAAAIGLAALVIANQALMLVIGGTDARDILAGGAR